MLTSENYYSPESNQGYMSASQFKSFLDCEARTLAELHGEYHRPSTEALLVGSYVDAYFEGTLDAFVANHPAIFTRQGKLKSAYQHADYIIQRVKRDKKFMQYMSGQKQRIFTGKICGVPFKSKIDSYHEGLMIVDLKVVRDFNLIYDPAKKRNCISLIFGGMTSKGQFIRRLSGKTPGKHCRFIWLPSQKSQSRI